MICQEEMEPDPRGMARYQGAVRDRAIQTKVHAAGKARALEKVLDRVNAPVEEAEAVAAAFRARVVVPAEKAVTGHSHKRNIILKGGDWNAGI